jgi:hypothetical protein
MMSSELEYLRKINEKYNKGVSDGMIELFRPGLIWGKLREQYTAGYKQGRRLKRLSMAK